MHSTCILYKHAENEAHIWYNYAIMSQWHFQTTALWHYLRKQLQPIVFGGQIEVQKQTFQPQSRGLHQWVMVLDLYLSPKTDWLELFPERLCMPTHYLATQKSSTMYLLTGQCRLHKAFHPQSFQYLLFFADEDLHTLWKLQAMPKNCIPLLNSSHCREQSILETPWIHISTVWKRRIQTLSMPLLSHSGVQLCRLAAMCIVMLLFDCLKDSCL